MKILERNMSDSLVNDLPILKNLLTTDLKDVTLLLLRRRVVWLILKITNESSDNLNQLKTELEQLKFLGEYLERPLDEIFIGTPIVDIKYQEKKGAFRLTKGLYEFFEIKIEKEKAKRYLINAIKNNSEKDVRAASKFLEK